MKDNNCICQYCSRQYLYVRGKGSTRQTCNSCIVNKHKRKRKLKIVKYLGGKCKRCSYNKCVGALSCHHIDPNTKSFSISGSHCRKWSIVKEELKKCELLCANCHFELHWDENTPV